MSTSEKYAISNFRWEDQVVIEIKGLTKRYKEVLALDDLNLNLDKGEVFGYIGPNGAGKTTTLRILATLLKPTSGTATICGFPIHRKNRDIRKCIGFMPDFFGVYDDMTVEEYLTFFAAAYGIKGRGRSKIVDDVLDLTDLGGKRGMMVDNLSRGMKQRLGVARVLIHNPQVLLLDEPASGLDPRARIEIRELIKELRNMGKTIMLSSHILSELAEVCTRIGIIEKGKLIVEGNMKELMKKVSRVNVVHVGVDDDMDRAKEILQINPNIVSVTPEDEHLVVELSEAVEEPSFVAELLLKEKLKLRLFSTEKADLEDVFMRMTKGVVS